MKNLLKDMKIRTRIFLLLGLTLTSMSLVAMAGLWQVNVIGKEITNLTKFNIPLTDVLSKITFNSMEQRIHFKHVVQHGMAMAQDATEKDNFETEINNFLEHGQATAQEIAKGRELLERVLGVYRTSYAQEKAVRIDYELRNISKEHSDYQFAAKRVLNLLAQGRGEQAEATIKKIYKQYVEENPLENLLLAIEDFIRDSTAHAQKNKQTAIIGMLLFSALVLLFGLGFGILISRGISKPLQLAVNIANRITAGDRDITITTTAKNETGQLLETMKEMSCSIGEKERSLTDVNQELEFTVHKLNQSNQQLKEFIYVASHDLREPVRKISSFGQFLTDSLAGKLNDDEQENFDYMIDGANRMQQMIEALLAYSRVTTKDIKFEEIDLNETVEQIRSFELAVRLEETGGCISVPERLPVVRGDPAQIRQLLQNFIGNALKYHKKEVVPEVTIRAYSQENGMVRIEVEDNGIGIKTEQCENVFVMFKRLHSRQEYDGTGIGLAVCKRIVERHKGEIGVSSTYGQGSTFWFQLPVLQTSEEKQMELISSCGT